MYLSLYSSMSIIKHVQKFLFKSNLMRVQKSLFKFVLHAWIVNLMPPYMELLKLVSVIRANI